MPGRTKGARRGAFGAPVSGLAGNEERRRAVKHRAVSLRAFVEQNADALRLAILARHCVG